MRKIIFVTGTDTGVGKTMAVYVLALLLRNKGFTVGVMKPVQSGGKGDAEFFIRSLRLTDAPRDINPYLAREPLAPHLALRRAGTDVDRQVIRAAAARLSARYDILLVEGAGGLSVPIADDYWTADLVRDLGAGLVITARPGLGTINHTLLTLAEARRRALTVAGVIFCDVSGRKRGVAEQTNAAEVARLGAVEVLGHIPYLRKKGPESILSACRSRVDIQPLLADTSGKSGPLIARDKQFVWHPFTQMRDWEAGIPAQPLVIDRAEGVYLIDADGRKYIDGVSSLWVTVHGHGRPEITEAIARQAARLDHSTMLGLTSTPAVELAEKLIGIAPKGLARVFYSDNGSTAVEVALKMAYQYWQNTGKLKKTVLCHLANSYHGDTLGSVSVGGIDLFHQVYRQLIFRTHRVDFPDGYRTRDFEAAQDAFEAFLKKEHARVAALVVEPVVQGAAGMIVWPKGVLKRFEMLCRKYDIFLICDEVATGFGRTGRMFACEREDVHPDFLCMAKGLSGGVLPLAATLTTARVYEGFKFPYADMKAFFHGHTYTGNPVACAAALANLELFRKDKTLQALRPRIGQLARRLERLRDIAEVGDIRQCGFMAGVELVKDRATREPFAAPERMGARVCERARHYGVILRPLGNVIVIMPPLSITADELDHLMDALELALKNRIRPRTRVYT
jgi:adenosylmethionine-8-amino-7-oxononanoate aminotransferase